MWGETAGETAGGGLIDRQGLVAAVWALGSNELAVRLGAI